MDWLWLIIAAVVGIIIGAIPAFIQLNRRSDEYQYRIRDLEGKFKNADRDLNDVRGQLATTQANLRTIEANYSDSQSQLKSMGDEKMSLTARVGELEPLQPQLEEANHKLADLNVELEGRGAELATLKANAEATAEALTMREQELAARTLELDQTRFDLGIANSMKADLETKLQRVRADVASELAMLSSSALKLKDDAINEANARINALAHELDAYKNRGE